MSDWVSLEERPPEKTEGLVIGCDWYPGYEEDDFRMAICKLPAFDAYWCAIKKDKVMRVFKSMCPDIGHGHNAHWMEIPVSGWTKFDIASYPYKTMHEVLIKLKNGEYYVGFIEAEGAIFDFFDRKYVDPVLQDWCPSFNMAKHSSCEDIDCWRELPEAPEYIPAPALTNEEKKIEEDFAKSFYEECSRESTKDFPDEKRLDE